VRSSLVHEIVDRVEGSVTRPRAADDFATIRARMEELRREREGGQATAVDPSPFTALLTLRLPH
jgi:hypothetical protein